MQADDPDRWPRLALWVAVVAAVPALLVAGRDEWFFADEWLFIAYRGVDIDGILLAHSGHWVSSPFLVFQAVKSLFGLHTYVPYQLLVILVHCGLVLLIRAVMRRMGVDPWVATGVAAALLLFGGGAFNIVFAFQISINGSLALGLIAILLATERPMDRRRMVVLALVVLLGLTTSGAMLPIAAGVGIVVWFREGLRRGVAVLAGPGMVYLLWFAAYGDSQSERRGSVAQMIELFVDLTWETLLALGRSAVTAGILGLAVAVGLGITWRDGRRERSLHAAAIPAALAAAWLTFAALTAVTRSGSLDINPEIAGSSRYVHVGAVLLLPLIALGVMALKVRSNVAAAVPLVALAFGVPGNVHDLFAGESTTFAGYEDLVVAVAHSPYLDQLPDDHLALPINPATVRWMREAVAHGDLPDGTDIDPLQRLTGDLTLVLRTGMGQPEDGCEPGPVAGVVTMSPGDALLHQGQLSITAVDGAFESEPRPIRGGAIVRVAAGPIDLRLRGEGGAAAEACVVRGSE